MTLQKFVSRWFWLLLVALLGFSCSHYKLVKTQVFESKTAKVELLHDTGPGGVLLKKGFAHPTSIKPDDFSVVMRSLYYVDPVFLWKEKDRPIFSDSEIEILAPQIVQALEKANADQSIGFSIKTWKKDLVFGSDKITSGVLFFNDKGMNWAFGNVNLTEGQDGDISTANPLDSPPKGVKIALHGNQDYYRPVAPRWYEASEFPNWIVSPNPFQDASGVALSTPEIIPEKTLEGTPESLANETTQVENKSTPAPHPKKSVKNTQTSASPDDATQRLRRLKTLLDEKLISPQDYDQKKKEILKDL